MKPENKFKHKLKKAVEQACPDSMVIIHNDPLNVGMPDLQLILKGESYFWEIKYIDNNYDGLKQSDFKHPFSPKQCLWAKKAVKKGIVSVGIIGFKDGLFFIVSPELIEKGYPVIADLRDKGLWDLEILNYSNIEEILKFCKKITVERSNARINKKTTISE